MQAKSASEYFVFVCLSEKLDLALIACFVKMISEKKNKKPKGGASCTGISYLMLFLTAYVFDFSSTY